jgi:uncharacterized protein (TIGR02453 family)
MLAKSTFDFLKKLRKNNHRDWFHAHRDDYEAAKDDFRAMVAKLLEDLTRVNGRLAGLEVKDLVFRINRDVRFSANKDPYKTNFGAYFVEGGKKSGKAGLYLQVEPGNCFMAGGCWMPPAPQLKSIRQEIDYNLESFNGILKEKSFRKWFVEMSDCRLKTVPKGYDKSNPAIDHLRQTSFIVERSFDDKETMMPAFNKDCVSAYKSMLPFLTFLNTGMEE